MTIRIVLQHSFKPSAGAADQMARNSSAFSDAPPISPPSTSGMPKQLRGIAGLDAAAVQDAQTGRDTSIARRHPPANEGMHVLGLFRRGRPARCRWPRPARRRRRHGPAPPRRTPPARHPAGAPRRPRSARHRARPAARPRTAWAVRPRDQRRRELARHQRVVLAVQRAPLGMPDEHIAAARRPRSIEAETSPVKAPWAFGADVLGAQRHGRSRRAARRPRPDRRRAGTPGTSTESSMVAGCSNGIDQRGVLGARAVHLPVACDESAASGLEVMRESGMALRQGRAMITARRRRNANRRRRADHARPSGRGRGLHGVGDQLGAAGRGRLRPGPRP